jgi:hypothetical protein
MPNLKLNKGEELVPTEENKPSVQERVENKLEQLRNAKTAPVPFEPRCKVCTSPSRAFIDSLIAKGYPHSQIADKTYDKDGKKLDRRSVSRHSKRHLPIEQEAIRRILEEEADLLGQNFEEGVKGAITRRGILEVLQRKGFEKVLANDVEMEVKDLIKLAETLERMDQQVSSEQVDQMRAQVAAVMQAIREVVPRDYWDSVRSRARALYESDYGELNSVGRPQITEAQVVEDA